MERYATDTPARRALERDISNLLQQLDTLERDAEICSTPQRHALTAKQGVVAEQLTTTVAALRSL